jgi:hypothetical protein
MKRIKITILGLLLSCSLSTTAAYAQTSTPNSTSSSTPIYTNAEVISVNGKEYVIKDVNGFVSKGLLSKEWDQDIQQMLLLILIAGGFGGLVFELLNLQGNLEMPHLPTEDELAARFAYATPKNVIDLGFIARLIIGALAAVPTIAIVAPQTTFQLIATSLVAGSSGALVFRALQDRLVAAMYQKEIGEEQKQTKAENIIPKLETAITAIQNLEDKVLTTPYAKKDPEKPLIVTFIEDGTLDPKDISAVWTPLNEAKAIKAQAVDKALDAFKKLDEELNKVTDSLTRTSQLTILKNKTLNLEFFNKVKQLLNEAKSANEVTLPLGDRTAKEEATNKPETVDDHTPPQPQSKPEQNGALAIK